MRPHQYTNVSAWLVGQEESPEIIYTPLWGDPYFKVAFRRMAQSENL